MKLFPPELPSEPDRMSEFRTKCCVPIFSRLCSRRKEPHITASWLRPPKPRIIRRGRGTLSYTPAVRRDTSFSLLRHAVELVRAEETPSAVEYIERALAINPWEAETAARLGTVAEVFFSRGEFVHAKRYLDWARRITKNRALTLRLTGLDFQIELMKGNSMRPSMMIRLIKEFGHHDPGLSACLLSIGALHMAERWQVEDAEQLLEHAEQFLGEASGESLAVNQRARLLADAVKGSVDRISRAADDGATSSPASLLLKGRALTYSENYEGARDLFSLVRNLSAARDGNWSETARYFAADNEIRAGNFRSAFALIDEIAGSASSQQYHRGMRNYFLLWRAHSVGDTVEAQACLAEAQKFVSADAPPRTVAQLFAWQGHFALMRGELEEAGALLSRAAEIGSRTSATPPFCAASRTWLKCSSGQVTGARPPVPSPGWNTGQPA